MGGKNKVYSVVCVRFQTDVSVKPGEVPVEDAVEGSTGLALGSPAALSRFCPAEEPTGATPTDHSTLHLPTFPAIYCQLKSFVLDRPKLIKNSLRAYG